MTFPGILFIRGRSEKLNLGYRIYRREKNMDYKKERKNWELLRKYAGFHCRRDLCKEHRKRKDGNTRNLSAYKSVGQSAEI